MNSNKNYLVTLGVSALIMITLSVIIFMLMLPKQSSVSKGAIKEYEQMPKSQYTFESTKDISSEPLTKQYSITTEDMNDFKATSQYKTGNSDPFAPKSSSSSSTSTSSSTGSTGVTTNNTTTSAQQEAVNRTTNSNGGVANPEATGK